MESTVEIDKAIAYFMGWRIDNTFPDKNKVWRSPGGTIELDTTFKFKSDWNALMEVFEAVSALEGYEVKVTQGCCSIRQNGVLFNRHSTTEGTMQATYICLSEFIKEYNKEQAQNGL